jgi:hypothetical protein
MLQESEGVLLFSRVLAIRVTQPIGDINHSMPTVLSETTCNSKIHIPVDYALASPASQAVAV